MDTCLNDCYDVPRARQIFESTRHHNQLRHLLKTPTFNKFILAYGTMALRFEEHREAWLNEALTLFNRMETRQESVEPNAETYVAMLLLSQR